ncbi:hypothetical protein GP486_001901 [Trichoglossum hirsutum]|uniref:BTB domain-containing protein n=1 Tax=Trichoglossum hirsutum TaxID=265104 RepID=A0A9P8LG09_9PEZI|nr:hypothetical protein GP486_001901 [Trichoglossum hirsutum]
MVPKPRQNNPQSQPITTTLANILRDYPAGGTVLRELLQNADDAGASKIDFHLSTASAASPESPHTLLHQGLLEYQGPAVLAHNSHPPFLPEDFKSLSLVGDSLKQHDVMKTGKFGLGFNSVYNWTDSPSVLSGNSLLLLDPHHSWSADIGLPGGPRYDFVDDADQLEMINQLKPFSEVLVGHDLKEPLDGTVVRLPLRTTEQAQKSRICKTSVGVDEIREVLERFAEGFDDGYGIFLRNVEEVGFWEDGKRISCCKVVNLEEVRGARAKITEAYRDVFISGTKDNFSLTFDMELELNLPGGGCSKKIWAVHHMMQRNVGPELTEWGRERKLFGWVGVAAPLQEKPTATLTGGLFTVLPLDKPSGHPTHLHGLFSITSDRASIHSRAEKSLQDRRPFLWNEMLFHSLIPVAWLCLLNHLRHKWSDTEDLMDYWPRPGSVVGQLGEQLCHKLVEFVQMSSIRAFFTESGFVNLEGGLFTKADDVSEELRLALKDAGVPVVYIQQRHLWLHNEVHTLYPSRLLTSKTICDSLRSTNSLEGTSIESKRSLLEYILSNADPGELAAGLKILYGVPLFRMGDGAYRAFGDNLQPLFLSVDETEDRIFRFQPERNLDLRSMSTVTVKILENLAVKKTTPIRRHSVDSFIEYCLPRLYQTSSTPDPAQDVVPMSSTLRELISDIWGWLIVNAQEPRVFSSVSRFWLIPLYGGQYLRRPKTSSHIPTLHSLSGPTGQLLIRLANLSSQSTLLPLLDTELLKPKFQRFLVTHGEHYGMTLGSCEDLGSLLPWLVAGREAVQAATDGDKRQLLAIIAGMSARTSKLDTLNTVATALKQLPLFEQVVSRFKDGDMFVLHGITTAAYANGISYREQQRKWIDQCQGQTLVGIGDLPFAPEIRNVAFVCCDDQSVRNMLHVTRTASWPPTEVLLEKYLIPSLTPEKCRVLPDDLKTRTLELILSNHLSISPSCRLQVGKLSIVPVEMTAQSEPSSQVMERQTFRSMSELLDPRVPDLKGLFFSEELWYPRTTLLDRFDGVMQHYGLKSRLTWELAVDRIRLYASTRRPLEEVGARVRELLELPIDSKCSDSELQEIKDLEWFVAKSVQTQQWEKIKPTACQDARYRPVVGRVLSVLEYEMHVRWLSLLGQNGIFSVEVLKAQLEIGIAEMDMDIVDAVLTYIGGRWCLEGYLDALRSLTCVLGRSGKLFSHNKIFRSGATLLSPHVDVVDIRFLRRHKTLIEKLGVATRPSLDDLLWVQGQLAAAEQPLDEAGVTVAVEVVKLASLHHRSELTGLKIPDQTGCLQEIKNITYWDMLRSSEKETVPLVHPRIPEEVVEKLAIQKFSEKVMMGLLGADDQEDEDEYFQHEETTTRIADTLGRYSIVSTFSEYLANAEDSSATCIDWLLDECLEGNHPSSSLLTKDLQAFQGPALFVHNDSVFLDEDFDGFKKVGRGSKREEEWAIGQFGRGAQTMFHWTDVPMLISGKFFVILDPQQKFLPLNRKHGRRKPGLKLELYRLRESCPDQLAPFDGLWGYSKDLDDYDGTIFRFPLRSQGSETKLTEITISLGCSAVRKYLEEYFLTARTSLLFLLKVKQISFGLRHAEDSLFQVRQREEQRFQSPAYQPFESVRTEHFYMGVSGKRIEGSDDWRIARQDILTPPEELKEWQRRTRKRQKYSKCGIAALLSPATIEGLKPRMFSSLPLPFESHLPVHINASFALSGDRRNIVVEETASFDGSAWNRWLLQDSLPHLYLQFLEDLVRILGADVFKFWPTMELSKDRLSDIFRIAFWGKVPSSRYRLYPRAKCMAPAPVLRTGRGRSSREPLRPIDSYGLSEAMFDFLCDRSSNNLQDLLRSWYPNLIRVDRSILHKNFKALDPPISKLTPSCIRKKLQTATVCDELEKGWKADPNILKDLLEVIQPRRDGEREELDGCRILPLRNGSLGVLRLVQSGCQTYFFTTAQEQKLFSFASHMFIRGEIIDQRFEEPVYIGTEFLQWLVKSSAFNVRNLAPEDLKRVLSCRDSADWAPTAALEGWLRDFWAYFNKRIFSTITANTDEVTIAKCGIGDFQLLKASRGCDTIYISPKKFDSLPAVIKPWQEQPALLCTRFPDLYVVDRGFAPHSFVYENFIPRFLKAIREIANIKGVDLGEVLSSSLNRSDIKILRNLIREFIKNSGPSPIQEYTRSTMRLLPIWPSVDRSAPYVAAKDALAISNAVLLVPWLHQRSRFIKPEYLKNHDRVLSQLEILELDVPTIFSNHILKSLPASLSPDEMKQYRAMLDVVAKEPNLLLHHRGSSLVANGLGVMKMASELYDHEDDVYSSAFGLHDSSRFLHPDLRKHRRTWIKMGLRGGPNSPIDGSEYLACIQSLKARINNLQTSDVPPSLCRVISNAVLQGLARLAPDPDRHTRKLITQEQVVYSGAVGQSEPGFRQTNAHKFKEQKTLLSLSEVVRREHAPYCWTQAQFSHNDLPRPGFQALMISGAPPVSMVWDHLRALVEVAKTLQVWDVKRYLDDLSSTYRYLQENTDDNTFDRTLYRSEEKVWLNIDVPTPLLPTVTDINSAWMDVPHLLLFCPYDPGDMQSVRSYLTPYQELLKRCGCQPILTPTWRETERPPSSESMPGGVSRLWKDSKLTDITFETKGQQRVSAHKLVLAAASEKYEALFTGGWASSPDVTNGRIVLDRINHATLIRMLDFAYHDRLDFQSLQAHSGDEPSEIADKLDDLVDLLAGANEWLMTRLHSEVEYQIMTSARLYVRPDNVRGVLRVAEETNSKELEGYCKEYIAKNSKTMEVVDRDRDEGVK